MIFKIDVDGVLRDIVPTMCKVYNEKYGTHLEKSDVTVYDVSDFFTECENAADFFFVKNGKEIFLESPTTYKAKEALDMLHEAGHKIVICTWQFTDENKKYTIDFLSRNNIYYDDICFTKDKDIVKCDVIIDDNPEFISKESEEGTTKILIDCPYNSEYPNNGIKRYDNIYSYVYNFLKRID